MSHPKSEQKRSSSRRIHLLSGTLVLLFLLLGVKLALSVGDFVVQTSDRNSRWVGAQQGVNEGGAPLEETALEAGAEESATEDKLPRFDQSASVPELMAYLEEREAELQRQEELLQGKEQYLVKLEKEVEEKMRKLIVVQKEIQAYQAQHQENRSSKIRSLAQIYGTMKPKEAAKLLETLDHDLVVEIISTMKTEEAAGILTNMDVKKAAEISRALSSQ